MTDEGRGVWVEGRERRCECEHVEHVDAAGRGGCQGMAVVWFVASYGVFWLCAECSRVGHMRPETRQVVGAALVLLAVKARGGCVLDLEVPVLASEPGWRLRLLLVRLHDGRLLVPVQDAVRVIAAVEAGGLSVRDVSLAAGQWPEVQG